VHRLVCGLFNSGVSNRRLIRDKMRLQNVYLQWDVKEDMGEACSMGEVRNIYKVFIGKLERKTPLETLKRRYEIV
jgi:hypothetical protein